MAGPACKFLRYQTGDGRARVECRFVEGTRQLTQALMVRSCE